MKWFSPHTTTDSSVWLYSFPPTFDMGFEEKLNSIHSHTWSTSHISHLLIKFTLASERKVQYMWNLKPLTFHLVFDFKCTFIECRLQSTPTPIPIHQLPPPHIKTHTHSRNIQIQLNQKLEESATAELKQVTDIKLVYAVQVNVLTWDVFFVQREKRAEASGPKGMTSIIIFH